MFSQEFEKHVLSRLVAEKNKLSFTEDYENNREFLISTFDNCNVLILGAAGSIGESVVKEMLKLEIRSITLVDSNENALVDLLRSIRSDPKTTDQQLKITSLSITGQNFVSWLENQDRFDYIFNFAAAKHVRAERDIFSIVEMFDINFLWINRAKIELQRHGIFFSVSTDKAASPTSYMGLSKMLMEQVMFQNIEGSRTTRFANVAFSNGSLLNSWLDRVSMGQILAVPIDCFRYFVSLEDSGKICILSSVLSKQFPCTVPDITRMKAVSLEEVLTQFLSHYGYRPEFIDTPSVGDSRIDSLITEKKWPVLLTKLDTQGEKEIEIFVGQNDLLGEKLSATLLGLTPQEVETKTLEKLLTACEAIRLGVGEKRVREKFLEEVFEIFPMFNSSSSSKQSLDSRI
jgi:FlaA1/EpsC-like NDP-sugar epimerase